VNSLATAISSGDTLVYQSFHGPGNGFTVGMAKSSIQQIVERNCAGAIKYQPNCTDTHTTYAEVDGYTLPSETSFASANSGVKVQGDPPLVYGTCTSAGGTTLTSVTSSPGGAWLQGMYVYFGNGVASGTYITTVSGTTLTVSNPVPSGTAIVICGGMDKPDRVTFDKLVCRNQCGYGLLLNFAGTVGITDYEEYNNGHGVGSIAPTNTIQVNSVDRLSIVRATSEQAGVGVYAQSGGSTGIGGIGFSNGSAEIGSLDILDAASATITGAYGVQVSNSSFTHIGRYRAWNDQPYITPNWEPIYGSTAPAAFIIDNYTTNLPNCLDIRTSGYWIGNPVLSVGTFSSTHPLNGVLTGPYTAGPYCIVNNDNIRSVTVASGPSGAGFVEPTIEIIAMNGAAQTLGQPRIVTGTVIPAMPGYTWTPGNYAFTIVLPGTPSSSEVYSWRIVGYTFRTSQFSMP